MTREQKLIKDLRKAIAKYATTEGCDCCEDHKEHKEAAKEIGRLLKLKNINNRYDLQQLPKK